MDGVSVFTAIDKLHAMPNSGKKNTIFSSWPLPSLLLIEIFLVQAEKHLA